MGANYGCVEIRELRSIIGSKSDNNPHRPAAFSAEPDPDRSSGYDLATGRSASC